MIALTRIDHAVARFQRFRRLYRLWRMQHAWETLFDAAEAVSDFELMRALNELNRGPMDRCMTREIAKP